MGALCRAKVTHNLGQVNPVRKVAAMLHRRMDRVLNYCKHEVTNAVAEGLNSKIMAIKRRACGYRNKENFKTAIYFFCGGLDLCPRKTRKDQDKLR